MRHHILAIFFAITAMLPAPARTRSLGNDTIVSLVTFYPGSEIYELEGHTAVRITMPEGDWAVSYGTFDFDQPNFVYRFVKGETDYWVTVCPWEPFEDAYRRAGRRIVEQQIAMTPRQKQSVLDVVAENLLPENRTYRYNYVKDNCATRPLRVVERALGDSIILADVPAEFDDFNTWREVMTYCHRNYPWYQFGIDLALGQGIDKPVNNREKAFAPIILCGQLKEARTASGLKVVAAERVLNDMPQTNAIGFPTPWYARPMTAMLILLAVVLVVCAISFNRNRRVKWIYIVFYTLLGLTGCLLAFLIFVSVHEATSPNLLFIVFNPLCFIGVVAQFVRRSNILARGWFMLNVLAVVVTMLVYIVWLPLNPALWPVLIADLVLSANYLYVTCKKRKK